MNTAPQWFFVIAFVLFIVFASALVFIDIYKSWKRREREELRRESFIRSVQTIATYCFYKGLSEDFEMDRE